MNSAQLKPEQVERLTATVFRQLKYLNAVIDRMQMLRFPEDDPVAVAAREARDFTQKLHDAVRLVAFAKH